MKKVIHPVNFRAFAVELKKLVDEDVNTDELIIDIDVSQCLEIEEIFKVITGSRKTTDETNREKYERLLNHITSVNISFSITRVRCYAEKNFGYKVQTPYGEKECGEYFVETFCEGVDKKLFCANLYQKARFKFTITIKNSNEKRVANDLKYAGENFWNRLSEDIQNKDVLKKHSQFNIDLMGRNFDRITGERIIELCQSSQGYNAYIQGHNDKIIIVDVASNDIFDEEFRVSLLFGLKGLKGLKNSALKFKQYILILNLKDSEYYRACTYLSMIVGDNFIVLNKDEARTYEIKGSTEYHPEIGNLLPACYIDEKILDQLKKPIDFAVWDMIIDKKITQEHFNAFDNSIKALWPYYRICQRFLFEEFSNNISKSYTALRNAAYGQTRRFYDDYAGKIPFLALMVFAIYDAFYRSHLLQTAKDYYGTAQLQTEDFLLSRQAHQKKYRFDRYEENKELFDIKNLLLNFDETNNIAELHPTVISEIIESVSISEGILQLLENAVRYADGGLFSLRIFSRTSMLTKEGYRETDNVAYLDSIYGKYYFEQYKKLNRHADFYLDMQISDLSEMSIPNKFYENHKKNYEDHKEAEEKTWQIVSDAWEHDLIDLYYFFEPRDSQRPIRAAFYEADTGKNLIYHYGLDIFRTIVENRKGIFSVSGYQKHYSNLSHYYDETCEIEDIKKRLVQFSFSDLGQKFIKELQELLKNERGIFEERVVGSEKISGTRYRILLPLGHDSLGESMQRGENVIVQQDNNLVSQYKLTVDLTDAIKNGVDEVVANDSDSANRAGKMDDIITNILKRLQEKYTVFKCTYYINWENLKERGEDQEKDYGTYFEEIIKGILLFALNATKDNTKDGRGNKLLFPLALINMTEFQLLNAARIIATYYSKSYREKYQPFQYVQIYLKSQTVGTEVIFAGETLEDVKSNLIKSAMTNGIMFQEITTILRMVESFSSNS